MYFLPPKSDIVTIVSLKTDSTGNLKLVQLDIAAYPCQQGIVVGSCDITTPGGYEYSIIRKHSPDPVSPS